MLPALFAEQVSGCICYIAEQPDGWTYNNSATFTANTSLIGQAKQVEVVFVNRIPCRALTICNRQ